MTTPERVQRGKVTVTALQAADDAHPIMVSLPGGRRTLILDDPQDARDLRNALTELLDPGRRERMAVYLLSLRHRVTERVAWRMWKDTEDISGDRRRRVKRGKWLADATMHLHVADNPEE